MIGTTGISTFRTGTLATALVVAWLSAGAARARGETSIVISEPVNLTAAVGAKSSAEGVHGGTQTRICRTSHGAYAAFLGKDGEGEVVIHVLRFRDGGPERLATLPSDLSGSNGVQAVVDADEEVYVVAAGTVFADGRERATPVAIHVDRDTGATTEYRATVPFGRGNSFGYGVAFPDAPGRSIYALYSGGDAPGYLAWVRFDASGRRWDDEAVVAETKYRHCYAYGFADGNGGAAVLAERDVRVETVGVSPTAPGRGGANYVWDELRLFKIPDLTRPDHRAFDVETAVYDRSAGLYPNVQNNFGGDTFVDPGGRVRVLYRSTDNDGRKGGFNRLAILGADGRTVSNEPLSFQEAASMRTVRTTDGGIFVVAVPQSGPGRIQVWKEVDAEGPRYELAAEKRLGEDVRPSYAGLVVSCPRGGSIRDDEVDALFPSGHDYYYFHLSLK